MLEKVIENWLDRASERSFQAPFCYMLAAEGHTVIHSTRHCAMEMGKDIIAIAPDGVPCAYQLKGNPGSKLSLSQWREEVSKQVIDLVMGKIVHPSLDSAKPHHRAYLVTNGELDEEVSRAIDDMNRAWKDGEHPYKLEVILRGQLLAKAKALGASLWPSELKDNKTLLELFLLSGRDLLPKEKLASLFEAHFDHSAKGEKEVSKANWARLISSGALLCSVAITPFLEQKNHVAIIEAWVIYIATVLSTVEKWSLPKKLWKAEFDLAADSIFASLGALVEEIKSRESFSESDPMIDSAFDFHRARMTTLAGLCGVYGLWRDWAAVKTDEIDEYLQGFSGKAVEELFLWGEAATPYFLAHYWYWKSNNKSGNPDQLLMAQLTGVCARNGPKSKIPLASPYYGLDELLPHILGTEDHPLDDSFDGASYSIESLIHLAARRNWKRNLQELWPEITRIAQNTFEPEELWQALRWRNEQGTNKTVLPKHTQEWQELKAQADESSGATIPDCLRDYPVLCLLILSVYPHRLNANTVRWLDSKLGKA